jgi:hypothetical protein
MILWPFCAFIWFKNIEKMLLQMTSGFLQLESTIHTYYRIHEKPSPQSGPALAYHQTLEFWEYYTFRSALYVIFPKVTLLCLYRVINEICNLISLGNETVFLL